jgi:hypothetical protein
LCGSDLLLHIVVESKDAMRSILRRPNPKAIRP